MSAPTSSGISSTNSTAAPLATLASFTGTALDCTYISNVSVGLLTDVDGTLYIELSVDGTNWDIHVDLPVIGGKGFTYSLQPVERYLRVRLVNGTIPQTFLRLTCKYLAAESNIVSQSNMYAYDGSNEIQVLCDTSGNLTIDEASSSVLAYGYDGSANQKLAVDTSGNVTIDEASSTIQVYGYDGSANQAIACNSNGELTLDPATVIITNPVVTSDAGVDSYRSLSLSNTGAVVKASGGTLYSVTVSNGDSSDTYVKIYNKATAATSADTPILTLCCPCPDATTGIQSTTVLHFPFPQGIYASAGLSVRASVEAADAGTTSNTSNTVQCNISYK